MDTIELSQTATKNMTFADKFSKFKTRLFIVIWMIVIAAIFHYTSAFFYTLYSITKAQKSNYIIKVQNDIGYYTRVEEKPTEWIPLDKISKRVQQAIISSEDGKFYEHPGYDLLQLRDAINESFVLKKKMRGASTITQQLVKNLYLNHKKTFGRKASELVLALMIERYADKKKILEMYLNVIEYGKGLYGISAASKYYFNKSASNLNARESAFLAMLLPSPKKYSKSFKNKTLTPFAGRMIAAILLKMQNAGYLGESERISQMNGRFTWEKAETEEDLSAPSLLENPNDEFGEEFEMESAVSKNNI